MINLYFFRVLLILLISFLFLFSNCKNAPEMTEDNKTLQFEEMTVSEMQKGFAGGDFTITEVVKYYLDRIEKIDKNGPALNSILEINPDALVIAETLDEELKNGKESTCSKINGAAGS